MRNRLKKYGYIILWALLGIFIVVWLIISTMELWGDQQLANAYVAIGTLILAFATALLAFFSWRNIKSGYDREKRDRKERLLNEIIEWATDIWGRGLKCPSIPTSTMAGSKMGVKLYLTSILAELSLEYESISGRTEYINRIALSFGGNLQSTVHGLAKAVEVRAKLIEQQIDILSDKKVDVSAMAELAETKVVKEWISSQDWSTGLNNNFKVTLYAIRMNRAMLLDNAKQVIEEAAKIKTGDIG